jgi:Hint module
LNNDDDSNDHEEKTPLEISAEHYMYVERDQVPMILSAADVRLGDMVYYYHHHDDDHDNRIMMKPIIKIHRVMRQGYYAPLTQSGDMIVNGIRVSNYVQLFSKTNVIGWYHQTTIGAMLFFPQRFFCQHFITTCQQEIYINGFGITAYMVVGLGKMMNQCGIFGHFMIALFTTPVLIMKDFMEIITPIITSTSLLIIMMGSLLLVAIVGMIRKSIRVHQLMFKIRTRFDK